jgi:hypothetical protein
MKANNANLFLNIGRENCQKNRNRRNLVKPAAKHNVGKNPFTFSSELGISAVRFRSGDRI